jgi:hypothetical protein
MEPEDARAMRLGTSMTMLMEHYIGYIAPPMMAATAAATASVSAIAESISILN